MGTARCMTRWPTAPISPQQLRRAPPRPAGRPSDRATAAARPGLRPVGTHHLVGTDAQHRHRHQPLRSGGRHGLGRALPAPDPRGVWADHPGKLPIIAGTLIRLQVERLPGEHAPKPVWMWSSVVDATAADIDRWWQSFLRRFDLEHSFRLFKQTLGWSTPKILSPRRGTETGPTRHRPPTRLPQPKPRHPSRSEVAKPASDPRGGQPARLGGFR